MVTNEIHCYNGITLLIDNPVQWHNNTSFTLIVIMVQSGTNTHIYTCYVSSPQ